MDGIEKVRSKELNLLQLAAWLDEQAGAWPGSGLSTPCTSDSETSSTPDDLDAAAVRRGLKEVGISIFREYIRVYGRPAEDLCKPDELLRVVTDHIEEADTCSEETIEDLRRMMLYERGLDDEYMAGPKPKDESNPDDNGESGDGDGNVPARLPPNPKGPVSAGEAKELPEE
jgi:hypothetical protein